MRIRISHETAYSYEPAARSIIQVLRLTPRSFETQYVVRWRISTDIDCILRQGEDSLGNIVHSFSHPGPVARIGVIAEGEIETFDSVGVVRGAVEPLPPEIYLRAAHLAEANGALRKFAEDAAGDKLEALDRLHPLMAAIHETMTFDPAPTVSTTTAAESFALRRGVCQDFAHLQIACLRSLNLAARYVSGYIRTYPPPGKPKLVGADASHAWLSAFCPGEGWLDLDPTNNVVPHGDHVTIGWGRDYGDVSPLHGLIVGGGTNDLTVAVDMDASS